MRSPIFPSDEIYERIEREKLSLEDKKLTFEREKHARERWWHEDHLVNQRMTWLFTAQGLIAVGYGWLRYRIAEIENAVILNKLAITETPVKIGTQILNEQRMEYTIQLNDLSLPLLIGGTIMAIFALGGLAAARIAQTKLDRRYRDSLGLLDLDARLGVSVSTNRLGFIVSFALPAVTLLLWGYAYCAFHSGTPTICNLLNFLR